MGKVITPDNFSDLPEALNLDGLEMPAAVQQQTKPQQAPVQRPDAAALSDNAPSGGYQPSKYVVDYINSFPKDDIKKATGIDLDWLLKNTRRYGILEPLCNGTFTQYPVIALTPTGKKYVTFSLWKTSKEPGWNCAVHNVKLRYATDANGQLRKNNEGEYIVEPYNEPLKKGDVLIFDKSPLSPDEMDQLRLTGHLKATKSTTNGDGENIEVILSCDRWNSHQLCQTNIEFAKFKLTPTIWQFQDGTAYGIKSIGCVRPGDEDSPVLNAVTVHEMYKTQDGKWKEGKLIPSATNGEETILLPINGDVTISVGDKQAPKTFNLQAKDVARLVPSTTYFSKNNSRVVTFLGPRQLSNTAIAGGFWAGNRESLSYVVTGTKENAKLTPIKDDQHRAFIQWDAFYSRLQKCTSYEGALKNELEQNEKAKIEAQINRRETPATSLVVGSKI